MKYAFNTASAPELRLPELLAAAAQYGYDGLEIRSGVGHRHGIELEASADERRVSRRLAEVAGIALCCLGVSCKYADPDGAALQVALTERYLELAEQSGIPLIRVFCGRVPDGVGFERARHSVVGSLRRLGPSAAASGVTIVVETHDDWSSPAVLAGVLEDTGHPNVAAAWDVLHTLHDGEAGPEAVVAALGEKIRHVHFHDGVRKAAPGRGHPAYRPLGEGDVDHLSIAKTLLGAGYEGYVSGEWYEWEPHEVHLPRELAAFKAYERRVISEKGGNSR